MPKSDSELQSQLKQEKLRNEILHYQKALKQFRISFKTLVEQCPKGIEEKEYVTKVIQTLIGNDDLAKLFFQKKKLPIKQLEKLVSVNKKTIKYHHNYIIAITIILAGDYVFLKDYINERRGFYNGEHR